MRNGFVMLLVLVAALGAGFLGQPRSSDAAFHIMRVYGVMGGALGISSPEVPQYVELRMPSPSQNSVSTQDICFFASDGTPYARFTFALPNPLNGADEASILIGNSAFDDSWAAGSPDKFFEGNTFLVPSGTATSEPIVTPAGKVSFGSDSAAIGSACAGSFSIIDSVAYGGAGYTGTVDFTPVNPSSLTTASTDILRLKSSELCHPSAFDGSTCPDPRDNNADYDLLDANAGGGANYPRNNASASGPLSAPAPDDDGDGEPNATDLCPGTAPSTTVDSNGCSLLQVDMDADGACDPGAPIPDPPPLCTGTDNCPSVANPGQLDSDTDTLGDSCDNCPNWPNTGQAMPPWTVPPSDPDCDGSSSSDESAITTDPADACGFTAGAPPESPTWPPDLVESNSVNISDVLVLKPVFGMSGPPRYNIVPAGTINISDVLSLKPYFGLMCTG